MHENSGYIPALMKENQLSYHFQLPRVESIQNGEEWNPGKGFVRENITRRSAVTSMVRHNGAEEFKLSRAHRNARLRQSYHGGMHRHSKSHKQQQKRASSHNGRLYQRNEEQTSLMEDDLFDEAMAHGSRGSGSILSNNSNSSEEKSSREQSDNEALHDGHIEDHPKAVLQSNSARDSAEAWWSVGEYLEGRQVTHQSAKFTLTGNRVFGNLETKEEVWDLSDSLAELYEATIAEQEAQSPSLPSKRHKGVDSHEDIAEWLLKDTSNGFIRVYPPDMNCFRNSQLIPCTLSTTAHKICLMMGIAVNALHIQLNGDKVRRLDPYEHPLVVQNEYLTGMGFGDVTRIQEAGTKEDLAYLVKFYSGKPMVDSTFSRNQLQAFIDVKKGKMMANWVKRLCVVSGTRLLLYKDKTKRGKPSVVQLAKGAVEEVQGVKGYNLVLKLTSTLEGEKIIFLSFSEQKDYDKWYRKCKKATDKLPTAADLSNCHLEFLPETIFINDQLAMLNLRHNVLKERPIEEDIYTIGWLDDLPKFQRLRSLNLADNNLVTFPLSLCSIKTLVELNIASNKLEELPPDIQELTNLQALHIHNNHLIDLPLEMTALSKLFILVLAFNHFTTVPLVVAQMTDVRISEVENIIMAGNQINEIPTDTLTRMKYVKKVDFRMNLLTLSPAETAKFVSLEHLTHLDIRDNCIRELDIRMLRTLEYLNVERNEMSILQLNGMALKNIFAAYNVLEKLSVSPKPEWLLQIDVSYNLLKRLPDWLADCFFLQKVNAGHNQLVELPAKLLVDTKRLKSLRVNHNRLSSLPAEVDTLSLEEIHVQHNSIARLPNELFRKANKLRVFNATKNRLTMLPQLNSNTDLNKVQEMYLTGNMLGDSAMESLSGYQRMKVLHIAHNEIHNLYDSDFSKLELLQELNISGNQLRSLPSVLGTLSKLVILRAHSNVLQSLPDFKSASSLRILDVGHNQLLNVSVTSLMASQLNLLDMSLNAQLKVDPREFKTVKHKKSVCLVDSSGQNRVLPGLHHRRTMVAAATPENPVKSGVDYETDPSLPWKVGFSETSGIRNKLCIATLKILKFESEFESLFGMFDGGHNNEVAKILLDKLPSIMRDELRLDKEGDKYMKYTMLSAHRKLKEAGQRVGASAAVCHIRCSKNQSTDVLPSSPPPVSEEMNHYMLNMANVGDVEIVLCRRGEALCLTRKFTTTDDFEECLRVYHSDGIITEDNKVNGSTKTTRQLGNSYLYPHVIPDPFTCNVALRHDDEFLIIASRGLWKYITHDEAVEEVYEIGNPVVAAKKLQDLAQGYGSKENIGVLVIRLNTDRGPSLARLRQHRSMSIDDVQAAAEHDARIQLQRQRSRERALSKDSINGYSNADMLDGSAPPPMKPERKRRSTKLEVPREGEPESTSTLVGGAASPNTSHATLRESWSQGSLPSTVSQISTGNRRMSSTDTEEYSRQSSRSDNYMSPERYRSPVRTPQVSSSQLPDLKPLPNQRYRKKNAATEWEDLLQKRLTDDVKEKEMKQASRTVSEESVVSSASNYKAVKTVPVEPERSSNNTSHMGSSSSESKSKETIATWRKRIITTPPFYNADLQGKLNDVYLQQTMQDEEELKEDIAKMEMNVSPSDDTCNKSSAATVTQKNRPKKVRNTIALFENLNKQPAPSSPSPEEHLKRRSRSVEPQAQRNVISMITTRNSVTNEQQRTVSPLKSVEPRAERNTVEMIHTGSGRNELQSTTGMPKVKVKPETRHSRHEHQITASVYEEPKTEGKGDTVGSLRRGFEASGRERTVEDGQNEGRSGQGAKTVGQVGSVESNLYNNVKKVDMAGVGDNRASCKVGESITEVLTDEDGGVRVVEIARL